MQLSDLVIVATCKALPIKSTLVKSSASFEGGICSFRWVKGTFLQFFAQLHCMVSRTADSGELGNQELVLQLSVLNVIKGDKDDNFTISTL